jgi:hypothetical protein
MATLAVVVVQAGLTVGPVNIVQYHLRAALMAAVAAPVDGMQLVAQAQPAPLELSGELTEHFQHSIQEYYKY